MSVATIAVGACGAPDDGTARSTSQAELLGTVWQWREFQDSAGGDEGHSITVSEPAKYTLTLRVDGRAQLLADCNGLSWPYALEGSRLTFSTLGPSTLAHCGDESLDRLYLQRLGNVATYVLADGTLYLNLVADGGNMVFVAKE